MREKFLFLMDSVSSFLNQQGFKKNGETFFIEEKGNLGLINIQKSVSSNRNKIIFTINLGVLSTSMRVLSKNKVPGNPSVRDCHWHLRIGHLMKKQNDHWWEITSTTRINKLILEITDLLGGVAIDAIKKNIGDEDLIENWRAGRSFGLPEGLRIQYLIIFLINKGTEDANREIAGLLEYAKAIAFYNNLLDNLKDLEITLP